MGLFDQFPYTNMYGLNLDWIMRSMKDLENVYDNLKDEIQDTIDFVNNFEQHADQLIDERIAIALSQYEQKLNALQKQLNGLIEEINKDDGVLGQINEIRSDVEALNQRVTNLSLLLDSKIQDVWQAMHDYKHAMGEYVDGKVIDLELYIKDVVTKVNRLDIVNPITGVFEDIQNVINDLYGLFQNSGYPIKAGEYDSLMLTARTYDQKQITAYDYDTRAYFELYYALTFGIMISPFDGGLDTWENLINRLADLHKCALTVQEYDNRLVTAKEYDDFQVTAWQYDWFGYRVLRRITAALYDMQNLSAWEYDQKKITAKIYDRGMIALVDTDPNTCHQYYQCGSYAILADQIAALTTQLGAYTSAHAGTTYVIELPVGETIYTLEDETITKTSLVEIMSAVKPYSIVVTPKRGVTITWDESATATAPLSFNVTVQNNM